MSLDFVPAWIFFLLKGESLFEACMSAFLYVSKNFVSTCITLSVVIDETGFGEVPYVPVQ